MKAGFDRYAGRRDEPTPPPTKSPTECVAHGCPLPGVYRQTNDSSICAVHEGEDAADWAAQTTRIRANVRTFDLAVAMLNAEAGTLLTPEHRARLLDRGFAKPLCRPDGTVSFRDYGAQLRRAFILECRGPKRTPPDTRNDTADDVWQRVAKTLGMAA